MGFVTLRVLHGADRGKIFDRLSTPVTIGREEGNSIQLNDERISRYHLKLQEDNNKIVLTDLESTNGTKVNGEDIQVRIVRYGDMIGVGRSLLLVGSRSDIDQRIAEIAARLPQENDSHRQKIVDKLDKIDGNDSDVVEDLQHVRSPLLPVEPPPLPSRMSPSQAAEFSELLDYIQAVLREATESVVMRPGGEEVGLDFAQWQTVLDLQSRIASLLRQVGNPSES